MKSFPTFYLSDKAKAEKAHFFLLANLLFSLAAIVGLLGALKIALPSQWVESLSFETLRPLHTFLSITAMLAGVVGLAGIWSRHKNDDGISVITWFARIQWFSLIAFIISGSFSLILGAGAGSGREYFSWSPIMTIFLLVTLFLVIWRLLHNRIQLSLRSPEGFWLVGFGFFFVIQGAIESQLWRLGWFDHNFVRDLSIQWHGIDTFFAGINTVIYGSAVFMMSDKPKPLRRLPLFAIAAFSLLFTFGHHHYASPQPSFLKVLAVAASMVAMLSFFRHLAALKHINNASYERPYIKPLWRAAELWTIVSIVSGVLFAIPQINLIIHGTYLIVIHAMGSMIGVNLMIILLGSLRYAVREGDIRPLRVAISVRLINFALGGLWVLFGIVGLIKGILRSNHDYHFIQAINEPLMLAFPVLGIMLTLGICSLCFESSRVNLTQWQRKLVNEKLTQSS